MGTVSSLRLVPSGLISVQALAAQYGISKSSVYELIKSDPTVPYVNVGVKKKLMIDRARFQLWLDHRTNTEKDERFSLSTAAGLLEKYKR